MSFRFTSFFYILLIFGLIKNPTYLRAATNTVDKINDVAAPEGTIWMIANIHSGEILAFNDSEKAFNSALPIGSLIKPILALGALENHVLDPSDVINCDSDFRLNNFELNCWYAPGHQQMNLTSALAQSCNIYFANTARSLTYEAFDHFLHTFDYVLPPKTLPQDQILVMIGRSTELSMTPVQVLRYLSVIFNSGRLYDWKNGSNPALLRIIKLDSQNCALIREGMKQSYFQGTGQGLRQILQPESAYVKTGTAPYFFDQVENYTKTHAWTVVFYPQPMPEIGLVVFVKEGIGSVDGVQWAGKILTAFIQNQPPIKKY